MLFSFRLPFDRHDDERKVQGSFFYLDKLKFKDVSGCFVGFLLLLLLFSSLFSGGWRNFFFKVVLVVDLTGKYEVSQIT